MGDEVGRWLVGLAEGDESAVGHIWETYFMRLVRLARHRLSDSMRRVADEEDVALSALNSLCKGAAAGRFPRLDDPDDLWKLLATITARKVIAHERHHRRQKRGGGALRGESAINAADSSRHSFGIEQVMGVEPTPQFAMEMNEACELLLDGLDDGVLKTIALMKLEGYDNREIAEHFDCTPRTVERRLAQIRRKWRRAGGWGPEADDPSGAG